MPTKVSPARSRVDQTTDGNLPALLRRLVAAFIERPAADLDPDLDAALRAFARRGIRHTTIPHIATELGVSRATLYRRIGTVDEIAQLVFVRELHRFVDSLPNGGRDAIGPRGIVKVAAAAVRYADGHVLITKIINDEPDLFSKALKWVSPMIERGADALEPFFAQEMAAGRLRSGPPRATAALVLRVILVAALAPPAGRIEDHFADLLLPVLEP